MPQSRIDARSTTLSASVEKIIAEHADMPGALLPILHAIQKEEGYIPPESVELIAQTLQISRAEVHGVITFYHDFLTEKGGKHVLQVCRAESCQAMGSKQLEAHVKAVLGIDYHQTTRDGQIQLEAVYCLGNCACSPSIRIDDDVYGRVTPERFDDIMLERAEAAEAAR